MIKLGRKLYEGKYRIDSGCCIIEGNNPFTLGDEGQFIFDDVKREGYVEKVNFTTAGRDLTVIKLV